jgi:hypothetical protein
MKKDKATELILTMKRVNCYSIQHNPVYAEHKPQWNEISMDIALSSALDFSGKCKENPGSAMMKNPATLLHQTIFIKRSIAYD